MKITKTNCVNMVFLFAYFSIYVGLFLAVDSLWIRGISLILLIAVLTLRDKYQWKLIVALILLFATIMLGYSIRKIPVWSSRVSGVCVGTDTVWGRNNGYVDSLIFTVAHGKKCIVEEGGWYNKYIEAISADLQMIDEIDCKILSGDSALINGFEEVGWMHIDSNFILLSDEANARFEEGERVYLYIDPVGLAEADTIAVWNDMKGNIYIETYDTSN